jgi:hypothetical protein
MVQSVNRKAAAVVYCTVTKMLLAPKCLFLPERHSVKSQRTTLFGLKESLETTSRQCPYHNYTVSYNQIYFELSTLVNELS